MAAFLRIYEPLDALTDVPVAQRAQWRALAASDHVPDSARDEPGNGAQRTRQRVDLATRERAAALRAASALPPRLVSDRDMIESDDDQLAGELLSPAADDGIVRVCPADLAMRALVAVEKLRRALPPELLSAFFPPAVITEVISGLVERAEQEVVGSVPHVRSSNWYIPLCWFAAFRPEQQVGKVAGRRGPASDQYHEPVRYLAPMADARRSVARALAASRRVTTDLMPAADLEELGRWLEEFHARSVVELDYAGLASLANRPELAEACVGSVATAIANIRSDDADLGSLGIEQLAEVQRRWAAIRMIGRAS